MKHMPHWWHAEYEQAMGDATAEADCSLLCQ